MTIPPRDARTSLSISPTGSTMLPRRSSALTYAPVDTVPRNIPLAGARTHALERATKGSRERRFLPRTGGNISSPRMTLRIPWTPARMETSSKRSASPASYSSMGMPRAAAASRRDPSRKSALMSTGTPNRRARRKVSSSSRLPRTWGRLPRCRAPVCKSIPWVQRLTISVMNKSASRAANEPRPEPGKDRLRSRRSGR